MFNLVSFPVRAAIRAVTFTLSCVLVVCSASPIAGAQVEDRAKTKTDATRQPAAQPSTPTWAVVCPANIKGGLDCYATQTAIVPPQANNPNLRVNAVLRISPETKEPNLVFLLPLGIYLPPGVTVQFGDRDAKAIAIETCNPNGCVVEYPTKDAEISALEKETDVALSVRTPDKTSYTFTLPGRGFKAAYAKMTSK